MKHLRTRARSCERAREYVSLRLDRELSDFEHALLHSHLERCERCRAFEADVIAVTSALRAAPPELPPHPIALPRSRSASARFLQIGAAAAAVVAALAVGRAALSPSSNEASAVRPSAKQLAPLQPSLRELRLRELKPTPSLFDLIHPGRDVTI
jgi:hypothetical protein